MIKFKEHDGLIFRMLDKPVPLTKDDDTSVRVLLYIRKIKDGISISGTEKISKIEQEEKSND